MNIANKENVGSPDEPIAPPKEAPEKAAKGSRQSRRERAILALLEQSSVERAAQAAGIHPSTLWRWLKQPEFEQALRQAHQQAYSRAIGRLRQGASAAVGTVFRIMTAPGSSDNNRLGAAKYVINKSGNTAELEALEDLQQRVTAMERSKCGPQPPKA